MEQRMDVPLSPLLCFPPSPLSKILNKNFKTKEAHVKSEAPTTTEEANLIGTFRLQVNDCQENCNDDDL